MYLQKNFQAAEIPSQAHISCYRYTSDKYGSYPLHCHPYYEISYIIKGERYELYNGMKYHLKENSLFFIPPLAIHGVENITEVEDIVLQFSPDFLTMSSASMPSDCMISVNGEVPFMFAESKHVISDIIELSNLPNCYDFRNYSDDCRLPRSVSYEWKRNSLILSLLVHLFESGDITITNKGIDCATLMQLEPLINRLLSCPEENLDMKEAASMVGVSYYHFSRLFKLTTGLNFSEYSNLLRVRKAEGLLLHSNQSILSIAASIGIDTPSYFTKLFKRINGLSPSEYRRKYLK